MQPLPPLDSGCALPAPSPDDEAFWQQHAARRFGSLHQPCCTLSGSCYLLGRFEDDFAVVIHGDKDCANSFIHHWMPGAGNFYGTALSEEQAQSGAVDEPLEELLRTLVAEDPPQAVLVLTTCLIELIGADPAPVVERIAAESSVPVVLMRTSGMGLGTQAGMADQLYETLASLPQAAPQPADPGSRRCNLIGLPPHDLHHAELREALAAGGVSINGVYPGTARLAPWFHIAHARLNVVTDRSLYPRLLATLQDRYNLPSVEAPLPLGRDQTVRFYRIIGEQFDAWEPIQAWLQPRLARLDPALAAFRERARGLRIALGLRMHNDFRPDSLSHGGLADALALEELGFAVTLLIQGPPEEQAHFQRMLEDQQCTLPWMVVPHPWDLAPLLREEGFHLACMPEHCLEEARKARIPMLFMRELAPFLRGVTENMALLDDLLARVESPRQERP